MALLRYDIALERRGSDLEINHETCGRVETLVLETRIESDISIISILYKQPQVNVALVGHISSC